MAFKIIFKETFDIFPDVKSLGMLVNHNCKLLFNLGAGINSAGYILPQSD